MGGNNIKSTAQKKIDGTYRPDRDRDRLENKVAALEKVPPAPKYFGDAQRRKWKEVCTRVMDMGVLTTADLDAVILIVQTWVMQDKAADDIAKNGTTILVKIEKEDYTMEKPMQNPAFRVYMDCVKVLKPLLEQFGLTPKSRQSIKVAPKEEGDTVKDFLQSRAKRVDMGGNAKTG